MENTTTQGIWIPYNFDTIDHVFVVSFKDALTYIVMRHFQSDYIIF